MSGERQSGSSDDWIDEIYGISDIHYLEGRFQYVKYDQVQREVDRVWRPERPLKEMVSSLDFPTQEAWHNMVSLARSGDKLLYAGFMNPHGATMTWAEARARGLKAPAVPKQSTG